MRRYWILPLAGLTIGVGLNAQPPEAGRKARGEGQPPAEARQPGQPGQPGFRGEVRRVDGGERKVDPQVEAWVKTLAEKITDPHDEIRDSARAALVAVGRPALATLRRIANGDDGAKVTAATKLMEAIEQQQLMQGAMVVRGGPLGGMGAGFGGAGGAMPREGVRPNAERPDANPRTDRPREGVRPNAERPDANPRPDRPREARPGEPGRGNPLEQILDDLGLNDKQRKQCEEIHETLRTKMRDLSEQAQEGKLDREAMREKRKEVHEGMMKEMKEILTAEQFTKFEEGMKKLGPPQGGPRPDRP